MSFTTVTGPLHYTQTHRSLHTFYMCMSIHIYAYIHIDVKICIYYLERERESECLTHDRYVFFHRGISKVLHGLIFEGG